VYALGVVAWEMLTGESLWGEGDQPPTRIHERQRTGARPLKPVHGQGPHPARTRRRRRVRARVQPGRALAHVRAFALAVAHAVTSEWGETGIETLRRVARELTLAPGDDSTAGRPLPPPLAPTLEVAMPMTPTRFPPGAVPIVAQPGRGADHVASPHGTPGDARAHERGRRVLMRRRAAAPRAR
jgi:hypothetical protein